LESIHPCFKPESSTNIPLSEMFKEWYIFLLLVNISFDDAEVTLGHKNDSFGLIFTG
jgi:hypothetical protein